MTSLTEHQLKSKYENSSRKIQELQKQFQAMKRGMATPSKRQRDEASHNGSKDASRRQLQRDLFAHSAQFSMPGSRLAKHRFESDSPPVLTFQSQTYIKNACIKHITTNILRMQKKAEERFALFEQRLASLKDLFGELASFYKLKEQKFKNKISFTCKCSEVNKLIVEMQKKYEAKIQQLVNSYDTKISLLVKESGRETSASSKHAKAPKQHQELLHQLEDQLIVKQQQITTLKIETSRLRRSLDQHKVLIAEKQSLVEELNRETEEQARKISQLGTIRIVPQIIADEKSFKQIGTYEQQITTLRKKNEELSIANKKLEDKLLQLNTASKVERKQPHAQMVTKHHHKSEWNESEILQETDSAHSDYEHDKQMVKNLQLDHEDMCEPLRHTHYFNAPKKRANLVFMEKIKKLEAELQLVVEENKLLKTKKDRFQKQCKENESDEEKFQQQHQILKEELKVLNKNLKLLDDCALSYLRQKRIPDEALEGLRSTIKFKEEYLKKYPSKKRSSSRS